MDPTSDLALVIENTKALEQIESRIELWYTTLTPFFFEFEEYANWFRLIESSTMKNQPNTFTKTRVGETVRATEALTTSIYRMQTSQEPCYDLVNLNGQQSPESLFQAQLLLRSQDNWIKWKRRLLRANRGLVLFGTQIVETPWVQHTVLGQLIWEGLGFVPRSLLQCAFEPSVFQIEDSPWMAFLDYLSEDQLLDLAEADPDHWNPEQVQKAINGSKTMTNISAKVEERRRRAGYRDLPLYEVSTYYGRLRDLKREDKRLWVIRRVNDVPIAAYGNPSPTGEIPAKVARYLDFEMEPYGYGVGRLGRLSQRHLDANREGTMDIIALARNNVWLRDKLSGIRKEDLKIRPLGIIDADNINGIRPLVPDFNVLNYTFKLEEMLRADHQGNTGATPNLQAQATGASATESSIAQNEGIRRVSVIAEDIAETFVRDYQKDKHAYNKAFFEPELWLSVTGMEKPQFVSRRTMAQDVDIFVKVVSDKDFRPERLKNLMAWYQIMTSIRNRPNILIDDLGIAKEISRALDINPSQFIRDKDNLAPSTVLNFLAANKQAAQNGAQEMGGDVADDLTQAGIPEMNTQQTPVGPVAFTP